LGFGFVVEIKTMVAINTPTRRCTKCGETKPSDAFRAGKNECYCRACRSALEKIYRQKPANKAKEREYARAYMRAKRFQCDDAIREANYYGYAVVSWHVHAYIPPPDEALMEKEEYAIEAAEWYHIIRRTASFANT
jgi:hypothetical protein